MSQQTADDAAINLVNRCPPNSIQAFPLNCTFTPTEVNYESVLESIPPMDFTWAEEADAAIPSKTFLHWNGNKYTNTSIQIVSYTHRMWVLSTSSPTSNNADCIMIFETNADVVSYKYIVFVIPLINRVASEDTAPGYLRTLANSTRSESYTIRTMFPSSPTSMFLNYTTCLQGYSSMKTPEMVSVFVSVTGIPVPTALMDTIKTKTGSNNGYRSFTPPFATRLNPNATTQAVGTKEMPFQDFVQTTNQLLNYANAGKQYKDVNKLIREDTLDSYQCVPLDPDRNIQDGKIKVDLDTGEVLSDVVAEREAIRAADSTKGSMEPGRLEKYMGSAIGVVLAVIFFSLMLYLAWNWLRRATGYSTLDGVAVGATAMGVGAASAGISESWAQNIPKYGLLILVGGFGGFLIGAMLS